MTFRLVFTAQAFEELHEAADWWAANRNEHQAREWLEGCKSALALLTHNPEAHSKIRESAAFPVELRQKLYGLKSKPTHRAVFEIRGDEVIVHAVRHLAREDLTVDDLEL